MPLSHEGVGDEQSPWPPQVPPPLPPAVGEEGRSISGAHRTLVDRSMWIAVLRKYRLLAFGAVVCTFLGGLGPAAIYWNQGCKLAGRGRFPTTAPPSVELPPSCQCFEYDDGQVKVCNYGEEKGLSVYGRQADRLCSGLLVRMRTDPIKEVDASGFCQ